MKVIVGSTSDRKVDVVKKVFQQYFKELELDIQGYKASSGVPDTPYDEQTHDGAINRARESKKANFEADYWIGLETGLTNRYGALYDEAWACVIDKNGKEYLGYSSGLKVPDFILKRMKELNMEHCDAMTIIEKELGDLPNDNWGTYSNGIILRSISLEEALRNTIVQLLYKS